MSFALNTRYAYIAYNLMTVNKNLVRSLSSCLFINNTATNSVKNVHQNHVLLTNLTHLGCTRQNHIDIKSVPEKGTEDSVISPDRDFELIEITSGDPVVEKKFKILQLEVEVLRQSGEKVPTYLKLDKWKELLKLDTRSKRKRYLSYLFGIEKARENKKLKQEDRKLKWEASKSTLPEDNHIRYALGHNSIFLRFYETSINQVFNYRLMMAMMFNQKLIIDCSYDAHMSRREVDNCGKQIMLLFSYNRTHDQPFDLCLCNINKEGGTMKQLHKYIPTLYNDDFPLTVTEKSYLELFPKEKLVYLTPHCREDLKQFDHDAIYIIGAMVDKTNNAPLSLAIAKKNNLKMAKLPLDRYLLWGTSSSKSLTVNQMISILLEIKTSGDWNKALKHVPSRKTVRTK